MRMEAGLDAGPVLAMRTIDIEPLDTARTLQDRLAPIGALLMCQTLDALAAGQAAEAAQPDEGVTYAHKISKAEALLDWREDAEQVLRRVLAFNPAPVAETRLSGAQLRIWEARLLECRRRGGAPRRVACSPQRLKASMWPAAGGRCASCVCSSPAASR